jgi:hypothetical protein
MLVLLTATAGDTPPPPVRWFDAGRDPDRLRQPALADPIRRGRLVGIVLDATWRLPEPSRRRGDHVAGLGFVDDPAAGGSHWR